MNLFKELFFILAFTVISFLNATDADRAVLEGTLSIFPSQIQTDNPLLINPGTPVKIAVKVKNIGSKANQAGRIYARFTLPKPLDKQRNSTLFTTELVALPPINPGRSASLEFEAKHITPSLNDFIREDWNLRHYQAVVVFDEQEYIIGSVPLTFSCFYYAGQEHESPATVPTFIEAPN